MSTKVRNGTEKFQVKGSLALKPNMASPLDEKQSYFFGLISLKEKVSENVFADTTPLMSQEKPRWWYLFCNGVRNALK